MKANTYVVKPFGISEVKVIALKGDPGTPTQEQINTAVDEYMTEHPEAQIPDGSITEQKLSSDVVATLNDVDNKADKVGSYPDLIAGTADNLLSSSYQTDRTPYLLRRTPYGARERGNIVGGSIVWNQLCNSASVTVTNGHKYFMKKGAAYSVGASTGTAITGLTSGSDMFVDLTLMLGPTIADYIYAQEQATAGAGVALAKAWAGITADYYPYDPGSIKSVTGLTAHKMTGKNLAQVTIGDITWNNGQIKVNDDRSISFTGSPQSNGARAIGVAHLCEGTYVIDKADSTDYYLQVLTPNGQSLGNNASAIRLTVDTPADYTIRIFVRGGKTYDNVTIYPMIRYADVQDATFEPYTAHSYPLDSTLTLRGLPKLDGDSIYYDGDIYPPSGEVERKYRLDDLASIAWTKRKTGTVNDGYSGVLTSAYTSRNYNYIPPFICDKYRINGSTNASLMDADVDTMDVGLYGYRYAGNTTVIYAVVPTGTSISGNLLYELAEPTTEQAEPYTALQICDPNGTEEWVGANMPVGHDTQYYEDLKGKIEAIPDAPSASGTYVLKATVSSSGVTYAWIAG